MVRKFTIVTLCHRPHFQISNNIARINIRCKINLSRKLVFMLLSLEISFGIKDRTHVGKYVDSKLSCPVAFYMKYLVIPAHA